MGGRPVEVCGKWRGAIGGGAVFFCDVVERSQVSWIGVVVVVVVAVVVVCGWSDGWRNGREKDLSRSFSKTVDFDRWRPFFENGWVVAKHYIDRWNGRPF